MASLLITKRRPINSWEQHQFVKFSRLYGRRTNGVIIHTISIMLYFGNPIRSDIDVLVALPIAQSIAI